VRSDTAVASRLLKTARRRAGLSQRALARKVGVSQPVIAAYESGRNQPTLPQLLRLLRAAGSVLDLELRPAPRLPDPERSARELRDVLDLADRLPQRHRRTLPYPRLGEAS
jgi:transcriptional regulator with XRE-family HTH domain